MCCRSVEVVENDDDDEYGKVSVRVVSDHYLAVDLNHWWVETRSESWMKLEKHNFYSPIHSPIREPVEENHKVADYRSL
jgi:hypothetical protein